MDHGRSSHGSSPGWQEIMARLLDHSFPDAPIEYDPEVWQRTLRDIEMSLTKTELPSEVEGKDENNALTGFMA